MVTNKLFEIKVVVKVNDDVQEHLSKALSQIDKVYSYKILAIKSDYIVDRYEILILVSQRDDYNTIPSKEVIVECSLAVNGFQNQEKVLVDFRQPPLELMLNLYEPLVNKLATEQHNRWKIEFNDLCQICRMCIIILYNKGYYIHKNLISTTFIREVLQYMRTQVRQVEEIKFSKLDKEDMEYIDYIEDESAQDDFNNIMDDKREVFIDRKKIVLEHIGQRQYDQMLREYRTNTTTNNTRKLVSKLKKEIANE